MRVYSHIIKNQKKCICGAPLLCLAKSIYKRFIEQRNKKVPSLLRIASHASDHLFFRDAVQTYA